MKLQNLEKFYSIHSKFYDATRWMFLLNRKKALSLLKFNKKDKILDLACGTGLNIPYLIKKISPKNILGIDYSKSMLEKARRKYPKVKFIQGNVSTFRFNQKFDKIVCTYSLSMIESWKETIRNVRKHLKKDGVFLVLDFHRWQGIIKPAYPIFRWWLSLHGVDSDRNYLPEIKKNFRRVEEKVINSGYNSVILAGIVE